MENMKEVLRNQNMQPKHLSKQGGKLSNDYGVIPNLRSPYVEDKKQSLRMKSMLARDTRAQNMRNYARSIVTNPNRLII